MSAFYDLERAYGNGKEGEAIISREKAWIVLWPREWGRNEQRGKEKCPGPCVCSEIAKGSSGRGQSRKITLGAKEGKRWKKGRKTAKDRPA